jgi:hypothetical protein
LENAAKVPADTGGPIRSQGVLTRVLTQPWPWVDQGVPLGVIGDVFEVMAQVDRRLTKVNTNDRILRVN